MPEREVRLGAEDVLHIRDACSSVFVFFRLDGGVRIEVVAGTARLLDLLLGNSRAVRGQILQLSVEFLASKYAVTSYRIAVCKVARRRLSPLVREEFPLDKS